MQVVLNIGSRDIRLVAARDDKILKWQTVSIEPGWVQGGRITQPREVAGVIDDLFRSLKLPRDGAITCIDGLSFTYRSLNLPRLAAPALEEAVVRAARKEIPLPVGELYLEWVTTGEIKEEVEVLIVGTPRSYIDTLVETFRLARVNLAAVGLKSLALARAAGRSDALIIDIEPDCFDITVISGGIPAIMHTVTPKSEGSNLEDKVAQLVDELNRTISFYNITHPASAIAADIPLLLSGSLAREETIAEHLSRGTGHPEEMFSTRLPLPDGFPVALNAANIGLLLKKRGRKPSPKRETGQFYDINIDLLNGRRRALAHPKPRRNVLLPVVLIILALLLLPLYSARNNAVAGTALRQTELDRIRLNLNLARTQNDASVQTEARIQTLVADTANLEKGYQLISGTGDSSAMLQFIVSMMAGTADYSSIKIGPQNITIDGQAASRPAVIQYVRLLEKFSKFPAVRIALIEEKSGAGEGDIGSESGNQAADKGVFFTIIIER